MLKVVGGDTMSDDLNCDCNLRESDVCNDETICSVLTDGDFVSVSLADNGDIEICSDDTCNTDNRIIEALKQIIKSNGGTYYSVGLYKANLGEKMFIYRMIESHGRYMLAGYIVDGDNHTRIKLMDAFQRRMLRDLK
jgi:hypothetical protein